MVISKGATPNDGPTNWQPPYWQRRFGGAQITASNLAATPNDGAQMTAPKWRRAQNTARLTHLLKKVIQAVKLGRIDNVSTDCGIDFDITIVKIRVCVLVS